jgi:outer membrane receptor for ferrienterochelin and colicins
MNAKLKLSLAPMVALGLASTGAQAMPNKADDIVVTAKSNSTTKDIAAAVEIITKEEIQETGAASLQDVLKNVAGFSFTSNSAFNGRKNVGLRGMDSGSVLILIDGERISETNNFIGHSNFKSSWVSLGAVERIEVIKGMGSVLYGSEAMGGVINIITKAGSKENHAGYSFSAGSLAQSGGNSARLSLNGGYKFTDKIYVSGSVVPFDNTDPVEIYRQTSRGQRFDGIEGQDIQSANVDAAIQITPSTEVVLGYMSNIENRTNPGAYYDINRTKRSVAVNSKFGEWDATVKAYETESDNFLHSRAYTHLIKDTVISAEAIGTAFDNHTITVGLEQHQADYKRDYKDPSKTDIKAKSTTQNSIYIQDKIKIGSGTLTAGVRVDDNDQFGSGTSPEIGYVFPITQNIDLKLLAAGAFKAPSILRADDNYFAPHGSISFQGNSDLEPETSKTFEIGVVGTTEGGTNWSASAFQTKADDLITTVPIGTFGSGTLMEWQNVNDATIKGAEFKVATPLTSSLFLDASVNLLDTDDGEGEELSYRPKDTVKVRMTYDMSDSLSTSLAVNRTGDQKDNGDDVPAYTLADIAFNKAVTDNTNLQFAVNNIGDVKHDDWRDDGYIARLPGREYRLTLSGSF